jgi:hypothetical protein
MDGELAHENQGPGDCLVLYAMILCSPLLFRHHKRKRRASFFGVRAMNVLRRHGTDAIVLTYRDNADDDPVWLLRSENSTV